MAETTHQKLIQLEEQQRAVLDFLTEQRDAVISGIAGTGKTMLATEKAIRHAKSGEKVLYLCYNSKLAQSVGEKNIPNVTIETIDGFVTRVCGHPFSSPAELERMYRECVDCLCDQDDFQYRHVIVDEGQDVCRSLGIEEILQTLKMKMEEMDGTFYIFYDKNQLLRYQENGEFPKIISEADCKLTLYRNCRNTENIAKSSAVAVLDKAPQMQYGAPPGCNPQICFCNADEVSEKVRAAIREITGKDVEKKDIKILSFLGESQKTTLNGQTKADGADSFEGVEYTTINRFKGLEARAVILVDFSPRNPGWERSYYVGASRAREFLCVISTATNEDVRDAARSLRYNVANPQAQPAANITNRRGLAIAMGLSQKQYN